MKIPGKLPLQTILKKLPQLTAEQNTELNKVISATSSNKIVSLNTKEIVFRKSKKSFSVKLINYVEPYLIKGQRYTLFYTEVDHNLKAGDRVFIESGNYDSDVLIQNNKFNKLSDGYIVQYVDRTKVVLDIEYIQEHMEQHLL
jgi:predicted ribosome-associated RNA-binding protein Tma20